MNKLLLFPLSAGLLLLAACNTTSTTTVDDTSSSSASSVSSAMMDESSSMMSEDMSSAMTSTKASQMTSTQPSSKAVSSVAASSVAAAHVINMTAESFKFTPNAVTFKKGEKAVIRLTGVNGVHGFGSTDLGFNVTVNPGDTVNVTIPTDKTGTFTFRCTVPCGGGHMNMTGTITIQ